MVKLSAALFLLAGVFAFAQNSTRDGVFTERQAARGQAPYKKVCASCHGESLEGSRPVNPALTGSGFIDNWKGQTLDDLFERIQSTMPGDQPGSLDRKDTADIVAYILMVNKFPAGKNEVPSAADELKKIKFDAR